MTQTEINKANYDLALKQVIESRLQWQEELKLLEIERDKTHEANERHWRIGYLLTVAGIMALVYVKLTAS